MVVQSVLVLKLPTNCISTLFNKCQMFSIKYLVSCTQISFLQYHPLPWNNQGLDRSASSKIAKQFSSYWKYPRPQYHRNKNLSIYTTNICFNIINIFTTNEVMSNTRNRVTSLSGTLKLQIQGDVIFASLGWTIHPKCHLFWDNMNFKYHESSANHMHNIYSA